MAYVTIPKILEYTIHPWSSGITINGTSYSSVVNGSVASNFYQLTAKPFNLISGQTPFSRGRIKETQFELIGSFQANATTLCLYRWQARNLDPVTDTWVNLTSNIERPVTTGWSEEPVLGRFTPTSDFNTVPFEVRCQFQNNRADIGIGRVNGASWIKVLWEIM